MPIFTTDFAPPPALSGLTVEADVEASAVLLSWDPSVTPPGDFRGYRVYRSRDGITFIMLRELAAVNSVTYEDYTAPLNVNLVYRVTQSNLDFESDPSDATVELVSPAWYAVVPGDTSLTFPIRRQQEGDVLGGKTQEVYRPMGRPGALVVGDTILAESGSISFLVRPDETAALVLLRRVQARMEGELILKATDGSVWTVQYGDIARRFAMGGMQEVSIPFTGVG
jgi:hypothetical protein